LNAHAINNVWQTEIQIAELLASEPSSSETEIAIEKLKRYKSPGTDQIPAEFIQAGGNTLYSEINKHISFVWNKEEMPKQWKESIIVPIYNKGDKTDCSNDQGISMSPATYKLLFNILLSRLTPCMDKITRNHQCGFGRNQMTTDQIF
jgi:hypothetical protein